MTLATQRSSEDRVLVHHEAITEYLTSSSNGHAFPTKVVDQLMEALEQTSVVVVHTYFPPTSSYGGEEQYYYEFRLEPLVQMDASNEMF